MTLPGPEFRAQQAVPARRYLLFGVIAVVGCPADLLTKHWVFQRWVCRTTEPSWWLVDEIFGFTTSLNEGALFGIGQGQGPLFSMLSLVAAVPLSTGCSWPARRTTGC